MVLIIQILKSSPNHLISFDPIFPPALPIFSVLAEVDLNQGKQHQRWPQGWVGDTPHITRVNPNRQFPPWVHQNGFPRFHSAMIF
jgi:hypothetical protein